MESCHRASSGEYISALRGFSPPLHIHLKKDRGRSGESSVRKKAPEGQETPVQRRRRCLLRGRRRFEWRRFPPRKRGRESPANRRKSRDRTPVGDRGRPCTSVEGNRCPARTVPQDPRDRCRRRSCNLWSSCTDPLLCHTIRHRRSSTTLPHRFRVIHPRGYCRYSPEARSSA